VKDFTGHEVGRLEVQDRVDDIGHLAHMADRTGYRAAHASPGDASGTG
jgi:hypothetical protein